MSEFILVSVFALCLGSFLNMLIYRLPKNISLFKPSRSICPNCNQTIKWYENIPLFSYLLLKGRCSSCKDKISIIYPLVELSTTIISVAIYYKIGLGTHLFYTLIFFYILIVLSFIDLKYKCVPDYLLLLLFIFSFFVSSNDFFNSLKDGMIFAGGFVLLNFIISFYIQNIKSKILNNSSLKSQEALGEGDIPVIASIGVILGLQLGLIAIFLSAIFAIIPSIYSNFLKKESEVAFIPYLFLGLLTTFLFEKNFLDLLG